MGLYKKATAGAIKGDNISEQINLKEKMAYACGDIGCNMSFALNASLQLFWTQFMGIDLVTWGIIILILKIWDAINDPIMGGLMDSFKPKPGQSKFKIWIFWGSFALIFSGALCFIPIPTAPFWVKLVVCFVGYLLWDMSYTIVNVPYGSLNSVITSDTVERSQLSTWRSIGAMIANVAIMIIIPAIAYNSDGKLMGEVMIWLGLGLGIIGLICFQLLCLGTKERVVVDYNLQKKEHKFNYFKSLGSFFKNRAAVALTLATIFQLLGFALMQNLNTLYIQQTFPKFTKFSGMISLMGFLPAFFFIPFIKKIVSKYGKKTASTWPLLLGILAGLILFIPIEKIENEILGIVLWLIPSMLLGLSISVNSMVIWAMVADCIDYQEVKTGIREEGAVYATYSLGRKLAQGFGASLIAFLLIPTGYIPSLGPDQAVGVNANIRLLLAIGYLICFVSQFVLYLVMYNLDKKKVQEIHDILTEKHKAEANQSLEINE